MIVAKEAELSLPIPEVCGSYRVIDKILSSTCYTVNYWKDENLEKDALHGPFLLMIYECHRQILLNIYPTFNYCV